MEDLFDHPAVQAGVLPFAIALIVAIPLRNTRHLGLAVAAGFLCAVALTLGFGLESLTSVKKLVLVGIGAAALGAMLELMTTEPRRVVRVVVAAGVALAVLWVLQRILMQRDAMALALAATGAAVYCVALLAGNDRAVSRDPVRAAATALVVGLATGVLALFGASAQLAQLGIALGAGAGAALLVQMLSGASAPAGWTLGFSAQVIAAGVGLLAVFTGSLPWYCLLPLPLVAWSARMAPGQARPVWQRAVLSVAFALVPAVLAVMLAWFTAGERAA